MGRVLGWANIGMVAKLTGWASGHISRLERGETVQFRPTGASMVPLIKSGQLVTVIPADDVAIDDIVLCKVKGKYYLHLVKAINEERYLIGNNRGGINGWTGRHKIYGKVIAVE